MKKNFTLIELLITIAIILIMVVVGVPAFNRYGAKAELNSKAEEIQAVLEKANTLSLSPPQGANTIHLWLLNYGTTDSNVVFIRPYNQCIPSASIVCPSVADDPGDVSSFNADTVYIPNYMWLKYDDGTDDGNADHIYCNFATPGDITCKNTTSGIDLPKLGENSFKLILTSEKTTTKYRFSIFIKPTYKVSYTQE